MQVYAFDLMPWPHLAEASHYPDSNGLYDPALGRTVYDEHFRQMELYEECGYDAICINEHHAKPYGLMLSPNLVAAVLTQRTKNIKIGCRAGASSRGSCAGCPRSFSPTACRSPTLGPA